MAKTIQMGFRAAMDTYNTVSELSKEQGRSISYVLNELVVEQLKRVEAADYRSIFYEGE